MLKGSHGLEAVSRVYQMQVSVFLFLMQMERLVHSLMPESVATQLLDNKAVEPEKFDSVTVYSSDVVSFTPLCASSTPMQVL